MTDSNKSTDSIVVDFEIVKKLGLTKALLLSYFYNNLKLGQATIYNGRVLSAILPMSKSTIYKAMKELVTDTYLIRDKHKRGTYLLNKTFYETFPKYKYLFDVETRTWRTGTSSRE